MFAFLGKNKQSLKLVYSTFASLKSSHFIVGFSSITREVSTVCLSVYLNPAAWLQL